MNFKPCKHLDHNAENYPSCTLNKVSSHQSVIKYFERESPYDGATTKVQFCGNGRGRINNVFDCYQQDGPMSCYEQ